MSRSRKHQPFTGVTRAKSEDGDKRDANRCLRRAVHVAVLRDACGVLPILREVSDAWHFAKDIRVRIGPEQWPKDMRK